jgi:hypothetical protein
MRVSIDEDLCQGHTLVVRLRRLGFTVSDTRLMMSTYAEHALV